MMRNLLATALVVAFTSATAAHAAITQYTSAANFNAAAPSLNLETFTSVTADTTLATQPVTLGGLTLEATNPGGAGGFLITENKIDAPPSLYDGILDGSNVLLYVASPFGPTGRETQFEISFATPVTAFGFDYAELFNQPGLKITVDGQDLAVPSLPYSGFWGFTSTASFSKVVFSDPIVGTGVSGAFDNVRFGTPAAAPEPQTWALMIIGFGGAGIGLRRGRRAPA